MSNDLCCGHLHPLLCPQTGAALFKKAAEPNHHETKIESALCCTTNEIVMMLVYALYINFELQCQFRVMLPGTCLKYKCACVKLQGCGNELMKIDFVSPIVCC